MNPCSSESPFAKQRGDEANPSLFVRTKSPFVSISERLIRMHGGGSLAHEYAVYAAIGAVAGLTGLALVLGVSDGALQAAIAVLAGLGGFELARSRGQDHTP